MNDLTDLKDAWGQPDPPSQTAYSAARAALMQQIAAAHTPAPAPKRPRWRGVRPGWLAGGTAVTAALAAAVAFAVPLGTTQPGQSSGRMSGRSSSQLSGQQILLAAATVAEARPASTGAYWHVKQVVPALNGTMQTLDTWTGHDGTTYTMPQGYTGVMHLDLDTGFLVGGSWLTFGQLEQLPTDPAALKAWITDSYTHPSGPGAPAGAASGPTPAMPKPPIARGDIPAAAMPSMVAGALSDLLWEKPTPPAVRAAAFRALASMPNVTSLGTMDGGQALRISFPSPQADKYPNSKVPAGAGEVRLVIDPATSLLLGTTNYQGTIKIITAEWTNEMPKVISPSHK